LSAPPTGSPNYDGPAERLLPANAKLNTWEQRFVLPPTALGISPSSILPSPGNLSYLAIVDDVSGLVAQYWYITDVSLQTVVSSPGNYAVNCVFIECASSLALAGGGCVTGEALATVIGASSYLNYGSFAGSEMIPLDVGGTIEETTINDICDYVEANLPSTLPACPFYTGETSGQDITLHPTGFAIAEVGVYIQVHSITAGSLSVSINFYDNAGSIHTINIVPQGTTTAAMTTPGVYWFGDLLFAVDGVNDITVKTALVTGPVNYDIACYCRQVA
jgi:hypothetical protein